MQTLVETSEPQQPLHLAISDADEAELDAGVLGTLVCLDEHAQTVESMTWRSLRSIATGSEPTFSSSSSSAGLDARSNSPNSVSTCPGPVRLTSSRK